jgi:hypothetical protein
MSIADSVARLWELAAQLPRADCPWESQPIFAPPAPPELILALERLSGGSLPKDLRDFLQCCGEVCAMGVHNGYQIGVNARMLQPQNRELLPGTIGEAESAELAIPVGADGGGNAFLLIARSGRVYGWNHETGRVNQIADSFIAFLKRVVTDWEHYLADDHAWHYLV